MNAKQGDKTHPATLVDSCQLLHKSMQATELNYSAVIASNVGQNNQPTSEAGLLATTRLCWQICETNRCYVH